jgi:hypothetical protein
MPTSPQEMMAAMMKNLAEKTGHDLNHWLKVVKTSGEEKHMAIIKHLKSEHGLTHGYANFIAFKVREESEPPKSGDDLVTDLFKGPKEAMKPLYDSLVKIVEKFGIDVDVSPRKTYVTIRRSKQFAIFKPSTRDRLDVGLILKGVAETSRLKTGKQFSGMMTHCVAVHSKKEIDSELKSWLKDAYDKA